MHFFDQLMTSFPLALQPPEPLVRYFQWVESQQLGRENRHYRYALIDPSQSQSHICLLPVGPWGQLPIDRLAPFCRTGSDGSLAALWRDEAGEIRIVHLGSGSGSVMVGVMAWNAVDFLRLLAIGYTELCWPDHLTCTPMQAFINDNGEPDEWDDDTEPPVVPADLQRWLVQQFKVGIPETAAEITGTLPGYSDDNSSDPFFQWLARMQN